MSDILAEVTGALQLVARASRISGIQYGTGAGKTLGRNESHWEELHDV